MTLPIYPNSISLSQIRDEFGQTGVASLMSYYAGGGIVPLGTIGYPDGVTPTPVPTSGAISFRSFYGTSLITIFIYYSSGTFSVPSTVTNMQILTVGGGGGGGGAPPFSGDGAGGGGAGGANYFRNFSVTPSSTLNITIGGGGPGAFTGGGTSGTGTIILGTGVDVSALGGGGGGGGNTGERQGLNGGSGGGGCGYAGGPSFSGGKPVTPLNYAGPQLASFGCAGAYASINAPGGGGGGAFSEGIPSNSNTDGPNTDGGGGMAITIASQTFSVAGGGGGGANGNLLGNGTGTYGGGNGGDGFTAPGAGGVGTGGGGGGGVASTGGSTGGNGGSGLVVLAFTETFPSSTVYPVINTGVNCVSALPGFNNVTATASVNNDGSITTTTAGSGTIVSNTVGDLNWYSSPGVGVGNAYWIRFAVTDVGDSPVTHSTTPNVWYPLTTGYTFTANVVVTTGGVITSAATILYAISTTNDESGRVSTGNIGMHVEAEGGGGGGGGGPEP